MTLSSWKHLWRTEDVLQSRGVSAEVKFPGYIEIKDHDHIYSPGGGRWHHQHDKAKGWTRLDVREECGDAEQVANSIIAHLSATKFDWDKYPALGPDGKPVDFYGRPYCEDLR